MVATVVAASQPAQNNAMYVGADPASEGEGSFAGTSILIFFLLMVIVVFALALYRALKRRKCVEMMTVYVTENGYVVHRKAACI